MAKSNKKLKNIKKEEIVLPELKNEIYMPCEWVIQFDNDEPNAPGSTVFCKPLML